MRLGFAILILSVGCSRKAALTAEASLVATPVIDSGSIAQTDAAVVDAALARADCAEASKLTQLGTVHEDAAFEGELLVGNAQAYDPETLATRPKPGRTPPPTIAGYEQVVGDFGLVSSDAPVARVENVRTQKLIVNAGDCTAGPSSYFISPTGRFLECRERLGTDIIELRPAKGPVKESWRALGEGARIAPNDRYVIDVPILSFIDSKGATGTHVVRRDLDSGESLVLLPAHHPAHGVGGYNVDFCGAGEIFAVSGEDEIVVFRGDGTRLAGVPAMRGGRISFSASGHYVSQTRGFDTGDYHTTIFRLDL
jgi:hypothetical protein